MIKLIATDMDGTFLDKQGQYDATRLKKLLKMCQQKGIYFVVASGRGLLSLKNLFADFQDDIIFLAENGSVVEYRGEILHEEIMPSELYLNVVEAIRNSPFQHTNTVHVSGRYGTYVRSDIDPDYHRFLQHYCPKLIPVTDFSAISETIYKAGANFSPEELQVASQWITETIPGVTAMTSGYECLDIMLEYVDKGFALKKLCEKLGLSLVDVLAFGDNSNDEQMLRAAGCAIVPENALSHIQSLADAIIAPHDTGSVMTYMEEIVCQSN